MSKIYDKAVAIKTVTQISNLIADDPDYETEWKPQLEKLLQYINKESKK